MWVDCKLVGAEIDDVNTRIFLALEISWTHIKTSWRDSSTGRALHRYPRGQGWKFHK